MLYVPGEKVPAHSIVIIIVLVLAALSCSRPVVDKISEFDIDGSHVRVNLTRNSVLTNDQTEKISAQVSSIFKALDPVDGDVGEN